jgi:uncharacterized protein
MQITQDSGSGVNFIRAYGAGELWINQDSYRGTIILSASSILAQPNIRGVEDLGTVEVPLILELEPELLLLGTGARQIFPSAAFGAQFLRAGVGFEVMDTGAACRTFNVLVGEKRRVVALLLL